MSSSMPDTQAIPARSKPYGGRGRGNLNAVQSLGYARDLEERVDRRSLLGQGLSYHRERLLAAFGVSSLADLGTIEAERLRRLQKLRVVRELRWGRVQSAIEHDNAGAFDEEEPKFLTAVAAEERAESRFIESVEQRRKRHTAGPSYQQIRHEHAQREAQDRSARERTAQPEPSQRTGELSQRGQEQS